MEDKTNKQQEITNERVIDVDAVLAEIGSFGKFQIIQYLLIGIPVVFTSFLSVNYVFVAEDIDYRCTIPKCESSNSTNVMTPSWFPYMVDRRCSRPLLKLGFNDSAYKTCSQDMFSDDTDKCNQWTYENRNSIVEAFDMACKPWQRTLVGTIHNAGMMLSMPLLGYVSDRFGRKTALIVSGVGGGGLGVLKTFAAAYPTYLTFEFLEATFGAAIYTSTFVLLVELGGKEKRTLSSAYIGSCIAAGEVIFALIALGVPYWKTLIRITYTPTILFISYIIILSESIRWLLINGKKMEAKKIIMKAAEVNGMIISQEVLLALDKIDINSSDLKRQEPFKVKDLFSSAIILQRLAISSFWWLSAAFIYYGMMINSVSLPGNKHVNFILAAVISFPGDLVALFTLNVFGRKKTLMVAFMVCGACCVTSAFVPKSLWWLGLVIFLLGKMAIATCFNGIYIYSSELFPTNMRTTLMGCCSMCARIGSIIAPQTPLLVSIMPSLPSILFGGFALTAGILMAFTPETLNTKLPDTVWEAEDIGTKTPAKALEGISD